MTIQFKTVAVEELINPTFGGTYKMYKDYYWLLNNNGEALFAVGRYSPKYGSPQCNSNKAIVESVGKQTYGDTSNIIKIERAFVRISLSDY